MGRQHFRSGISLLPAVPMVYTLVSVLTLVSHSIPRVRWSLICEATAFQKVLELISPTSIVAVPEFNKFLVHCDTALFSYPLDLVVRVSQGHATSKTLDESVERLAQKDGSVSFFKAGRVGHRTLSKEPGHVPSCFVSHPQKVVYAAKSFLHATLHVLELTHRDENTKTSANRESPYRPFGSVRLHTSA